MIVSIDNKGSVDLINNWSVGGRARHNLSPTMLLTGIEEARNYSNGMVPK